VEERIEKGLGKKLGELEMEKSDIDNEDALKSGWTNV